MDNEFVCIFLANMLDKPVEIPGATEATAWGAACLAGLQCGIFDGLEDISERWSCARRYNPDMEAREREALYNGWQAAINMALL